ncbi:protein-l-isoaspartate o-methyltransferase domain-containing protein 1, partial [Nannochloropsis oceanica]
MAYRSSGANNDELVENLKSFGIIHTPRVYQALRHVDRGEFMPEEHRSQAYQDQPFCTGYLSTVAGLLLEGRGVNHGLEIEGELLSYARRAHAVFCHKEEERTASRRTVTSATFFQGNVYELDEEKSMRYDRVYIGAACPESMKDKLLSLLLPGNGVLVGPMGDELVKITRGRKEGEYTTTVLSAVRFASLKEPGPPSRRFHLPAPLWTPVLHYTYPRTFQLAAKALLLLGAGKRQGGKKVGRAVPPAVWMEVLSFVDRQWFEPEPGCGVGSRCEGREGGGEERGN